MSISSILVIHQLDTIVERFVTIYQKNSASLKKEAEAERALNLMRSVLRVCEALLKSPEVSSHIGFQQWFSQCVMENSEIPAIR
jgi:hypothetical protein